MKIFIACAKEDGWFLKKLDAVLQDLKSDIPGLEIGHRDTIKLGTNWTEELVSMLSHADIIIPLVSVNFLTSEYFDKEDLQDFFKMDETGKRSILPLIIGYCTWEDSFLAPLQVFPRDGKPIDSVDFDKDLSAFVVELNTIIARNRAKKTRLAEPSLHSDNTIRFPQYCYFTLLDPITQDAMSGSPEEKYIRIIRNLKIALLVQEKVIFRATTIFKSEIAARILSEVQLFIETGVVIPEFREKEYLLPELKKRSSSQAEPIATLCEVVDFQKERTGKIVDGDELGENRTNILIDNLFRLKFWQDENSHISFLSEQASLENLDQYFGMLKDGIPDRAIDIIVPLRGFFQFQHRHLADAFMQAVYFGVGAAYSQKGEENKIANAFWSKEFDPLNHLSLWTTPFPKLRALGVDQFSLAKKYAISDRLERREDILGSTYVDYEGILTHGLDIPDEWLDLLSWDDILELRNSAECKALRRFLSSLEISKKDTSERGLRQLFNKLLRRKYEDSQKQIQVREYEKEDNEYNPAADINYLRSNPEYSTLAFSELLRAKMYNTG